jgi:hypothetical protein
MELTFEDPDLAETCSCRALSVGRWGDEGFESLALALSQLAAVDASQIDLLAGARLESRRRGSVEIRFTAIGELLIAGTLGNGRATRNPARDSLRIRGVDWKPATVAP